MDIERLNKINVVFQILASVVTIVGLSIIVWQAFVAAQALKVQARAVGVQTWLGISQQMLDIDKQMIDHPELYPYFDEGKQIRRSDKDYPKVVYMADMLLDFIDQFDDDYIRSLAGMEDNGKYWPGWDAYFADQFRRSPALCNRFEEVNEWYSENGILARYAKMNCTHTKQKEQEKP